MPQPNPIDDTIHDESRMAETIEAALGLAGDVELKHVAKAIKTGKATAIFKSPAWGRFLAALREGVPRWGLEPVSTPMDHGAQKGARYFLQTIGRKPKPAYGLGPTLAARKPILLDPEIAELGGNWARYNAGRLIREIDARTRANVRRLVRNASRRLARNPRATVLAQLSHELKEYIGLTSKQAASIERWTRRARRPGSEVIRKLEQQFGRSVPSWAVDAKVNQARAERIATAINRRARFIARDQLAQAFNEGQLRAARKAQRLGRVPQEGPVPLQFLKRAETVGDDRVRDLHQAVADSGAVPLDDPFPIFGADRPPWPGEIGCRCWVVIISPAKGPPAPVESLAAREARMMATSPIRSRTPMSGSMNTVERMTFSDRTTGELIDGYWKPDVPPADPKQAAALRSQLDLAGGRLADREILAKQIDDLFETDLVPVTVSRTVDDVAGTVQAHAEGLSAMDSLAGHGMNPANWAKAIPRESFVDLTLYDAVIGNVDRHWGNAIVNTLRGAPRPVAAIDNGLSFLAGEMGSVWRVRQEVTSWWWKDVAGRPIVEGAGRLTAGERARWLNRLRDPRLLELIDESPLSAAAKQAARERIRVVEDLVDRNVVHLLF